ncbi:PEP-CTERM sorting domain-containing protein [Microcystis sp. M061S2]|uniref:PEP-CTERM sorting domain-containing protein n=1 Tax=Microcystis sp. M061S2 TaxID=2771171 RepID=UPI0025900E92|nr:PEP-CTERM sorting domain-containing protein [Microcystis sp. M061S2]MCA2656844.1 PEP-CTERM sorting domain-containing protein [Microcystis sp. M061S2]
MKSKLINPLGLLLFTPFFAMLPLSKAQAFCNQNTPFGLFQCPGNTGGHQDMTRNALPFLRTTILDDILDEHLFQDNPLGNLNIDYIHFDNSNFTGGVNYINNQYTDPRVAGAGGVIAEFDPSSPQPFDATDEFGQLLHTAQDFYSHTNWVDYNPANVPVPLFDSGTGLWTVPAPYGVVNRGGINLLVVQGNNPPPAGVTFTVVATPTGLLRLVNVAGHPSGATQGLVGGAYGSGNQAPPGATIGHGDGFSAIDDLTTMNKDTNVRTNYAQAYGAAAVQTETEWCRMLNLTASRLGFAGSSIPMALWVDPNGNPHPGGTACAISQGSKSVQVSIKSIKVLNDTDPFGAGELNFPFVLYRKDFTKSVRTEVNSISVSSGNFVPKTFLPLPLTLDLNNLNDLVITLQAWDDDDGSDAVFDNISIDPDDVLKGITDFFPGPTVRTVKLITPGGAKSDLEVCLEIKVLSNRSNLAPQQVESEGCFDTEIPEPSSIFGLLAFGGLGLMGLRKKR